MPPPEACPQPLLDVPQPDCMQVEGGKKKSVSFSSVYSLTVLDSKSRRTSAADFFFDLHPRNRSQRCRKTCQRHYNALLRRRSRNENEKDHSRASTGLGQRTPRALGRGRATGGAS